MESLPSASASALVPIASATEQLITIEGQEIRIHRPVEPQPEGTILLPSQYNDGVFHVRYHMLDGMRRPALLELCKQYSLGTAGNKADLKARLKGFSENLTRWKCLIPGARRAHRGVREGKIVKNSKVKKTSSTGNKKAKLSTMCRNVMMGTPVDEASTPQIFAAERSKDTRTVVERQNLLIWAKKYRQANPYLPPEEIAKRLKAKAEAEAAKNTHSPSVISAYLRSTQEQLAGLASMVGVLVQQRTGIRFPPALVPSPMETSATQPSSMFAPALTPLLPMSTAPQLITDSTSDVTMANALSSTVFDIDDVTMADAPSTTVSNVDDVTMADAPSTTASNVDNDIKAFVITIGNGKSLTFKYTDILDPPQLTFANNIPRLDRLWDDERSNWDEGDCSKVSIIRGATVALRYWPGIFKHKDDQRWKGAKSLWTEWKYVAERYRSGTPEEFWAEFSSNNKHFTWKAICAQLRRLRVVRDDQLAAQAHAEFGDQFSKVFSYRGKVMTDKSSIARRYLSLKDQAG